MVTTDANWSIVTNAALLCSLDMADACRTGAATNVIFRFALGYKSMIITIFAITIIFTAAAMYGIAMAALHWRLRPHQ